MASIDDRLAGLLDLLRLEQRLARAQFDALVTLKRSDFTSESGYAACIVKQSMLVDLIASIEQRLLKVDEILSEPTQAANVLPFVRPT